MKILLVDDDAFLRDMYATKFTEAGDAVQVAKDGPEALREIESAVYDVIIMDMVMPGMSGVELLEALKSVTNAKDSKCIMLSNQGENADVTAAMDAGAVGYIVKAESIPSEVVHKVHSLAT